MTLRFALRRPRRQGPEPQPRTGPLFNRAADRSSSLRGLVDGSLIAQELYCVLRAVGHRQTCLVLELCGHLIDDDGGLPVVVNVEELRCQSVATGMALALVGVDADLHVNTTGNFRGPRTWPPAQVISSPSASENSGMRVSHSWSATCSSMRARFEPAQRWIPDPKATCRL